ncbi:hypothetical protein BSKO_13216 [Bryopsis sp. KO-2023]|nr:hypothetical protein BSKO_13216 [Bryopsis sp. KO-2023]
MPNYSSGYKTLFKKTGGNRCPCCRELIRSRNHWVGHKRRCPRLEELLVEVKAWEDENEASREERRLAPPLQQPRDGGDVGASSIPNDDVQDASGFRDENNDGLDANNDGLDIHNDGGGEVYNDVLDIHNGDGGDDNDGDLRGDGGLPAVDGSESDGSPGMDTEEETEVEEDDEEENSSETTINNDDSSVHNEDTDSGSVQNDGPDFFGDVHHNEELKTPLYPGCLFTLLHVIMLLLQQKADHGTTREAFEANLKLISAILPSNHVLPTSLLRIKRLLGVPCLEDVTYFSCERGCKFYHVKDRRFLRPSLDLLCEHCKKPIFTVQKGVSTALEPCLKIFYFGVKSLLRVMTGSLSFCQSRHRGANDGIRTTPMFKRLAALVGDSLRKTGLYHLGGDYFGCTTGRRGNYSLGTFFLRCGTVLHRCKLGQMMCARRIP